MERKIYFLFIVLAFSAFGTANAELYEYTDEKGVPHVTSDPAKVPESYKEKSRSIADVSMPPPDEAYLERKKASADKAKILAKAPKVPAPVQAPPPSVSKPQGVITAPAAKSVEIYVKSWCPYCKQAQSLLDSRGISYKSYDVEQDSSAYNRFIGLGGKGVPVLVIGGRVIHGFSADEILSALG